MSELPVIKVDNLAIRYDSDVILSGINFELAAGEVLSILGVSGAGKSSILRAIAGFVTPHEGIIEVAGTQVSSGSRLQVPTERRGLGMMFQITPFPQTTVSENVGFGIYKAPNRQNGSRHCSTSLGYPSLAIATLLNCLGQHNGLLWYGAAPEPKALFSMNHSPTLTALSDRNGRRGASYSKEAGGRRHSCESRSQRTGVRRQDCRPSRPFAEQPYCVGQIDVLKRCMHAQQALR